MTELSTEEWDQLGRDAGFQSHRLVGWIYWDPVAIERHEALGAPAFSYYVGSRAAPLAAAGNDVVTAAFYSIHPDFIAVSLDACREATTFEAVAAARDSAVADGLARHAPEIVDGLAELAEPLWDVADSLPLPGHPLFAAHRAWPSRGDGALSAWLAVNCIREWRGDTHWALHAAYGIGPIEAGVLDAAWRDHRDDWLPRSRGADDESIERAMASLAGRGWVADGAVNAEGIAFRQELEDQLDHLSSLAWRRLGADTSRRFVELIDGVGDRLLGRSDDTAGDRWMPAGRMHPRSGVTRTTT